MEKLSTNNLNLNMSINHNIGGNHESSDVAKGALPSIPDKHYFTIGEASELCGVKQHVLRYWEEVFPQLRPKRRTNRRYYVRSDLLLALRIRSLLHEQGYTIKGARQVLKSDKLLNVYDGEKDMPLSRKQLREELRDIVEELERAAKHMERYD